MLNGFFDDEMHRQHLVPTARSRRCATIGAEADIVILTNIGDQHGATGSPSWSGSDIRHRVICNQGGKGRPVARLVEEMKPGATVFVDDLPVHHESVARSRAARSAGCT